LTESICRRLSFSISFTIAAGPGRDFSRLAPGAICAARAMRRACAMERTPLGMGPTVAGRLPFAKNSFSRLDNRSHGCNPRGSMRGFRFTLLLALLALAACSCLPGGTAQGLLSEKNQTTTTSKSMSAGGGLSGPIVR